MDYRLDALRSDDFSRCVGTTEVVTTGFVAESRAIALFSKCFRSGILPVGVDVGMLLEQTVAEIGRVTMKGGRWWRLSRIMAGCWSGRRAWG